MVSWRRQRTRTAGPENGERTIRQVCTPLAHYLLFFILGRDSLSLFSHLSDPMT